MRIFFDIETIPGQRPGLRDELAASIKHPATMSKPETIAKWEKEEKPAAVEDAYLKTSFDGGAGQIICIAWAMDDKPVEYTFGGNLEASTEAGLLSCFLGGLDKLHRTHGTRPVLIGHNHIAFDIPFIWKRAIVHNIKPPFWFPRNPKPWAESVEDTMLLWDATQRAGGSMDKICRALGIPGKDGVSGADVWPMAQRGEFQKIADYCAADVERTRQIYKRMTFADAGQAA